MFYNGYILKNWKPRFTFWKKKRKGNQWLRPFASAISGNTFFHLEVLKHETEAMLMWVRNKLPVYYWFSENVKNIWNQCISINICLIRHKNVASQGKILEFWLLDTLKIEKLKLNEKLNLKKWTVRAFFPKSEDFFSIFKKGQRRPNPSPPPSPATYLSACLRQYKRKKGRKPPVETSAY